MAHYSTSQVAKKVGIGRDTLHRWMKEKRFPKPPTKHIGGVLVRLWNERDLKRVERYKAAKYRKGRGRKAAKKRV
jgi:predicted DNA-binding transcriptional regulator AlpA